MPPAQRQSGAPDDSHTQLRGDGGDCFRPDVAGYQKCPGGNARYPGDGGSALGGVFQVVFVESYRYLNSGEAMGSRAFPLFLGDDVNVAATLVFFPGN